MSADWVIDLGPGGGDAGGRIIAVGRAVEVARAEEAGRRPTWPRSCRCPARPMAASSRRDAGGLEPS